MDIRKLDKEKQQEISDKIDLAIESFYKDIERIGVNFTYFTVYKFWKEDAGYNNPSYVFETDGDESLLYSANYIDDEVFHVVETSRKKGEN